MTVSTSSYFSNATVGVPQVAGDVDIYTANATPKFAIGTKFERQDGCIFRYVQFGAATPACKLVAPDLTQAAILYTANAVVATSSAFQQAEETSGLYPGMLGSKYVVALIGATTANQYNGGYLAISGGMGSGQVYRIRTTYAANGTATTLKLYEKIVVGLDATSDIVVGCSKYVNLEEAMAGSASVAAAVGVALLSVATASPFAWIQTKGRALVAQAGGLTSGTIAVISDADMGCVESLATGAAASTTGNLLAGLLSKRQIIGTVVTPTASSGNALIDINLE